MSLSSCVRLCVRSHFVKFAVFKAFEARCFEGVVRVSQGCLLEVSRVFQGSFKYVSNTFQGCFKEVLMVLTESFKGV